MMDLDIIQRLRLRPDQAPGSRILDCLDAADEIERLQAALATAHMHGAEEMREAARGRVVAGKSDGKNPEDSITVGECDELLDSIIASIRAIQPQAPGGEGA